MCCREGDVVFDLLGSIDNGLCYLVLFFPLFSPLLTSIADPSYSPVAWAEGTIKTAGNPDYPPPHNSVLPPSFPPPSTDHSPNHCTDGELEELVKKKAAVCETDHGLSAESASTLKAVFITMN